MKKLIALSILTAVFFAVQAKEIRIDPAKSIITYQTAAHKALAKDLQLHLKMITGKEIPISSVKTQPADGKFVFAVGEAPAGAPASFKPEEARWKVTSRGAWFYGDKNRLSVRD